MFPGAARELSEIEQDPTALTRAYLRRRRCLRLATLSSTFMADSRAIFHQTSSMRTEPVQIVHTRVFAIGIRGGNPCPVVPFADRIADDFMQALARRTGLDTVFILKPTSAVADIRLRYFVPEHEMGVSGHATIAAITVALLNNILKSDRIRVETITGIFHIQAVRNGEELLVTLEQSKPVFGETASSDAVAHALRIENDHIVLEKGPVQSVSVSRPKLLIPLDNGRTLNHLNPDYEELWGLCDRLHVSGFYPFTRQTDKPNVHVEARQFPLRAGFREDAATGVAAAALAAYLATYDRHCQAGRHILRIAQGYAMGAPSLIEAIVECREGRVVKTAVRGRAQVVRSEYLSLD